MRAPATFESLKIRNYRIFFAGQVLNWTGTWVSWVAQGWLVLRLTDSGFSLGLITALQWSPILLFGAWAGVVADRFEKRKILLFTNGSAAILSLILGIATVAGWVTLPLVIVVAVLLGLVTALDNPTRQAFTMEMVGRERITNAVSLNTATFTIARVVGPVIAALLIKTVGIGECFLVNTVSFIPISVALLRMDRSQLMPVPAVERGPRQVREGMRYVGSLPVLKVLLIMMAVIGTFQYNFQVILPLLAKHTFHGDAGTFGLLGATLGAGMFIGSMTNATFGRPGRRIILVAGFSLALFTFAVAAAPTLLLAALMMIPLGASSMAFLATMNSSLQLTSSDAMRGRVMALYFVLFLGSTPIGAPILGWVAEAISPRAAFAFGATATLVACAYGYFKLPAIKTEPRGSTVPDELEEALQEAR
ncbi:MAG TPA: MFS transporter [Actinomycetota bacterium]|nr:MFS transporter [Actinomycetota bacterium]